MKRLLIVEDLEETQVLWREHIEFAFGDSVEVRSAYTLPEAKALFFEALGKGKNWHAIVMDACLGGSKPNTFGLVREIREAGFRGPMIAVSGDPKLRATLMDVGCSHEAEKHEMIEVLTSIIQREKQHKSRS